MEITTSFVFACVLGFLFLIAVIFGFSGINVVNQWERRPVTRWGKYVRALGPGVNWINPFTYTVIDTVDVRDGVGRYILESVQTHDNVPVKMQVIMTVCIPAENVELWTLSLASDDNVASRILATAGEVISAFELDQLLHDRSSVHYSMLSLLQPRLSIWGYQIKAVELQNIEITDEGIQSAIALKAKAVKEAEAELARALKQVEIANALRDAAEVYGGDAMWLKSIETLMELGKSGENNVILIPSGILTDVFKSFDSIPPIPPQIAEAIQKKIR